MAKLISREWEVDAAKASREKKERERQRREKKERERKEPNANHFASYWSNLISGCYD